MLFFDYKETLILMNILIILISFNFERKGTISLINFFTRRIGPNRSFFNKPNTVNSKVRLLY